MIDEKPPLSGVYLAHFGVKGMKWGQRRRESSEKTVKPKMSKRDKVATGLTLASIALTAGYILSKRGATKVPVAKPKPVNFRSLLNKDKFKQDILNNPFIPDRKAAFTKTADRGRQALKGVESRAEWKRKVSAVLNDMKQANAEQDSWMRKQGLGAVLNKLT